MDEGIVARAAAQGGLEPRDVVDEERRKSFAIRLLEAIGEGGGGGWALSAGVPATEGPSPGEIRALIRETVVQTAGRGRVVIFADAASYAIERGPRTLRVFVTASPATRAQRVAELEELDQRKRRA